jgi:hypothetical protein
LPNPSPEKFQKGTSETIWTPHVDRRIIREAVNDVNSGLTFAAAALVRFSQARKVYQQDAWNTDIFLADQ